MTIKTIKDLHRLIMGSLHKKYQEFKELYLQELGVELSDEQAEEFAEKLLKLARIIQNHKKMKDSENESEGNYE